jgi:hypothetical protein
METSFTLTQTDMLDYAKEISRAHESGSFFAYGNLVIALVFLIIAVVFVIRKKYMIAIIVFIAGIAAYFGYGYAYAFIASGNVKSNYLDPIMQNKDKSITLVMDDETITKKYETKSITYQFQHLKCTETRSFLILDDGINEKIIIPKNTTDPSMTSEIVKAACGR